MKHFKLSTYLLSALLFFTFTTSAIAHQHGKKSSITVSKISESIYLLSGKGGNIGASIGADGTFLIDAKFADNTADILTELDKLGGGTPKFVLNTHWHADHTGGNENFSKTGSIIVAHANVRKLLNQDNFISAFNKNVQAYPKSALPLVTFTESIHFNMNGSLIKVMHIAGAHTNGDSVAFFEQENVLHTGDLFFNGFYPFIDIHRGGSVKGMLDAADTMLAMINDETKIIPGHGPLATKADLKAFRDMLAIAYLNLKAQKSMDKTLIEAIKAKPLKELDKQWSKGIFTTDKWIETVYAGLD